MIDYLGSFTVGGCFPTMATLLLGVRPRLMGQLAGAARISGQLAIKMPSIAARAQAAARVAAAILLQPPGVKIRLNANVALIAALRAQLAIIADLRAALSAAGVEVFRYEGSASRFGTEVQQATGGGLHGGSASDNIQALVIATRYPTTFTAIARFFVV